MKVVSRFDQKLSLLNIKSSELQTGIKVVGNMQISQGLKVF